MAVTLVVIDVAAVPTVPKCPSPFVPKHDF